MHPFFENYLERLATLHTDIITVLERLPQPALDWKPDVNMNSIAVLVAHTAGAERYWIGDMTVRQTSERIRDTEFQTSGLEHSKLKELLDAALADANTVLEELTIEELSQERTRPHSDERYMVGWCLLHALEHTATHVGHVQLMGDMWEKLHVH